MPSKSERDDGDDKHDDDGDDVVMDLLNDNADLSTKPSKLEADDVDRNDVMMEDGNCLFFFLISKLKFSIFFSSIEELGGGDFWI